MSVLEASVPRSHFPIKAAFPKLQVPITGTMAVKSANAFRGYIWRGYFARSIIGITTPDTFPDAVNAMARLVTIVKTEYALHNESSK